MFEVGHHVYRIAISRYDSFRRKYRRIAMRSPTLDPTAGERARRIRLHPDIPERISDPTDPRYGQIPPAAPNYPRDARRIVDPTDPECGERPI